MYAKQAGPTLAYRCERFDRVGSYLKTLPDHPQDLLPSRNRAFMGSHSLQGVHHEHHPLRSTATRRALGGVTQDAGALARHWHRTKVHPTAWQGHLPFVRHRGLRKRVLRLFDCGTNKIEYARQTHIAIMFSPRGLKDTQV